MPRRPHHVLLIMAALATVCLGLVACSVDNSFDPVPPGGRREIYGDLVIDTQLEADNLVGIRRIVGDLRVSGAEITHLTGLKGLQEVTGELRLDNLRNIADLEALAALETVGGLRIWRCNRLKDLDPLRNAHGATTMTIERCDSLWSLPFPSFVHHLEGCQLSNLPALGSLDPLTAMDDLQVLRLEDLPVDLDYSPLGRLTNLTELILQELPLTELPDLTANVFLDRLELTRMEQLASLEGLAFPYLRTLRLQKCPLTTTLAGVGPCRSLEQLDLIDCDGLTRLDFTADPSAATRVSIYNCDGLRDLSGLPAACSSLNISACDSLESLGGLGADPALVALDIHNLHALQSLEGLPDGLSLEYVSIFDCRELVATGHLGLAPGGRLHCAFLPVLSDMSGLVLPDSLAQIHLYDIATSDMTAFAQVRHVDWLYLGDTELVSLAGLENLHTVTNSLTIFDNDRLGDASALAQVTAAGVLGVSFTGNPLLDSCMLEEMVAGWGVQGGIVIEDNGPCAR